MSGWRRDDRTQEAWFRAILDERVRHLPFRERFDPLLLVGVGLLVSLSFALLIGLYVATQRWGFGDKVEVKNLADARILENVHRELTAHPVLDGVVHQKDLWFLQEGGLLQHYRSDVGLWSKTVPFEGAGLQRLHSDDTDPAAKGRLWALTSDAGLAIHERDTGWRALFGESGFMKPDGSGFETADLCAAAISTDGRHLLLGTNTGALGLYRVDERLWHTVTLEGNPLSGRPIDHLVFWQDHFWVGAGSELYRLAPKDASLRKMPGGQPVIDMDVEPGGRLWVLTRQLTGGKGVTLTRYANAQEPGTVLMAEAEIFPELSAADLQFVFYQDPYLLVAGKAGLYSYHLGLHAWTRLLSDDVRVALAEKNQQVLHAAGPAMVARIEAGTAERYALPGDELIQMTNGTNGNVLGLTRKGDAYLLGGQGPVLMYGGHKEFTAKGFTKAIAMDDAVLLLGAEGGVLHNVLDRSYRPLVGLPPWLLEPKTQLEYSGENLYALASRAFGMELYSWPTKNLLNLSHYAGTPLSVPPAVSRPRDWGGKGLAYVTNMGTVLRLGPGDKEALVGPPRLDFGDVQLRDVTSWDHDLAVLTQKGLVNYMAARRSWSDLNPSTLKEGVVELASSGQHLLMRTQDGRLLQLSDATLGEQPRPFIGGGRFRFNGEEVSDGFEEGSALYLAGKGLVSRYDASQRAVLQTWYLNNDAPVTLAGTSGIYPLSLSQGKVFLGDQVIRPEAGVVEAAGLDNNWVWTFRRDGDRRYLRSHSLASLDNPQADRCTYLNPTPGPEVAVFHDARMLPNGLLLTATNAGLRVYSPSRHSWYRVASDFMAAGGQIHVLQGHMILEERRPEGNRMAIVGFDQLVLPHECGLDRIELDLRPFNVRQGTVQEKLGRVAWLLDDGRAWSWENGKSKPLLLAKGVSPAPTQLQTVFNRDNQLFFGATDAVWSYDLQQRTWRQHVLFFDEPDQVAAQTNLYFQGDQTRVSTRTTKGDLFEGELVLTSDQVALDLFHRATPSTPIGNPDHLVDVFGKARSMWVFALKDRVRFYDPIARAWLGEQVLHQQQGPISYQQGAGLDVLTTQAGNQWLVAQSYRSTDSGLVLPGDFATYTRQPDETTALDANRQVWRLKADGTLLRGKAIGGTYAQFDTAAGPANPLSAQEIEQLYLWGDRAIIQTASTWFCLDRRTDQRIPLPEAVPTQNAIRSARQTQSALWLELDTGVVRLAQELTGSLSAQFFQGHQQLRLDQENLPWAFDGKTWLVWSGTRFTEPPSVKSLSQKALTLFVLEGAQTTALDADGYAYSWEQGFVVHPLPLNLSALPDIRQLVKGLDQDWWVVTPDELVHLTQNPQSTAWTETRKPLPNNPWTRARFDSVGTLLLVDDNATQLWVHEGDGSDFEPKLSTFKAKPVPGLLADQATAARKWVRPIGGRSGFDPILSLKTNEAGMLIAVRPSGEQVLATRGDIQFEAADALDVGWLAWNRAKQRFQVATPDGTREYRVNEWFQNGQMLFEPIEAVVHEGTRLVLANRHGLWLHPAGGLGVDHKDIRFIPRPLTDVRAVHERFQSGSEWIGLDGKTARAMPPLDIGALRFQETQGQVQAQIQVGTQRHNAFGSEGFTWDSQRLGLVYANDRLLVRSDTGFHGINDLGVFLPYPAEARPTDSTWVSPDATLHLQTAKSWYRLDQTSWKTCADPRADREVAQLAGLSWRLRQGELLLQSHGSEISWLADALGPGFASDQLQAAAFPKGQIVVMSQAMLEWALDIARLGDGSAKHYPVRPTDRLEVLYEETEPQLYHVFQNRYARWDSSTQSFEELKSDPHQERLLINMPRLKVARQQGQTQLFTKFDRADGVPLWEPIRLTDGQFAFDHVTAVATLGNTVFVGTPIGLQVYTSANVAGLDSMHRFHDLRSQPGAPLVRVTQLGQPTDAPQVLVVSTDQGPLEVRDTGLVPSNRSSYTRLRAETPVWRWTEQSGRLQGRYRDPNGADLPGSVDIQKGHFTHDRLKDLVAYGGKVFTLWENGWIATYPQGRLGLNQPVQIEPTAFQDAQFHLIRSVGANFQAVLKAGLYLENSAGQFYQHQNAAWVAITDPAALIALRDIVSQPTIYQRARLRLRQGKELRFEYCDRQGVWQPLSWSDGKLAIDRWTAMATLDGVLWAATPDGLVSFRAESKGVRLSPDELTLIRDIPPSAGTVTDLEQIGDRTYLRLNQDRTKVFSGKPSLAIDRGVFSAAATDPFAQRVLLGPPAQEGWTWTLKGRESGRPGYLEITHQGQPLALRAGRFDFDGLTSLAFYTDGAMDFATESGGWYREKIGEHQAAAIQRVQRTDIDTSRVRQVLLDQEPEGNVLGLKTDTGYLRLAPKTAPQEVKTFAAFQAADTLWTYVRREQSLDIIARQATGGLSQRKLVAGRFTDDRVNGFPLALTEGTLVPTLAGPVLLNAQDRAQELHVGPFPGLEPDQAPKVLISFKGQTAYLGKEGLYALEGTRALLQEVPALGPASLRIERLVPQGSDWQAFWEQDGTRGFTRLQGKDWKPFAANRFFIDLQEVSAWRLNQIDWGNPSPWLQLEHADGKLQIHNAAGNRSATLSTPRGFVPLRMIQHGNRLVLVGSAHLLEVNLDQLTIQLLRPQN